MHNGKVLVLGGSGRFGRHAAEAFWNAGWQVTLFRRGGDLTAAAQGMDVILHGWNPPYPDWARDIPGQTRQVIAAARASGATVLLAGNLYVYGKDAPSDLGPHLPHAAQNPMGRLRIEMEHSLREAGIPLIVLRAGDFLDTEASGNWFDSVMAKRLSQGVLTYPGAPEIDHAWAFLPDMARAAVALAERRSELPRVVDIAFPGYTLSGAALAQACAEAIARPVRLKGFPWWTLQLARPFWRLAAPLLEMRYLWDKPHHIARASFDAALPGFSATPLDEALRQATAPLMAAEPRRPRPAHVGHPQAPAQ